MIVSDYYRLNGYLSGENTEYFLKRMAGCVRLYAAVIRTPVLVKGKVSSKLFFGFLITFVKGSSSWNREWLEIAFKTT